MDIGISNKVHLINKGSMIFQIVPFAQRDPENMKIYKTFDVTDIHSYGAIDSFTMSPSISERPAWPSNQYRFTETDEGHNTKMTVLLPRYVCRPHHRPEVPMSRFVAVKCGEML